MKLLKILTIFVLILFPFGELLRFEIGNNISLRPLDIAVGLVALWFVIWKCSTRLALSQNTLWKPTIIFAGIGLLSLLINSFWLQPHEFFASFLYLVRWISYITIIFIILQFEEKFKKKISLILFIDGLLILFVGYLQYFFYPSLKNLYYLGWDEHMHRMFSVFFDPNFAGAFFVLYFLFIAGKLYTYLQKKKRKESIIFSIILFITLIAIFLTFSRAALLMLVVGSGVFLFLINQKKLIFALLGAIAIFAISFSSQFYIENMNLFREASSKARIQNYAEALMIIQDRPLLGVGFNSYRYAKTSYGIPSGWTHAPSHADAGVDNSFLFVLATTGIIGLGAYLWLWVTLLRKAYALYQKKATIMAAVVISSSIGLFINSLFINSLFFPVIMVWIWVIIGLLEDKK